MEESDQSSVIYQVAYATKSGAKCKIAHCTLPVMTKGELRIGTSGSARSWFHVDCFFKRSTEAKVTAIKMGLIGRENIREDDLKRIDELSQTFLDAHSKKRKVKDVDDIMDDGRWPKRLKYDYLNTIEPPSLSNDNILEIFSYFNNVASILRALSLVNKQFNLVARSLMYKYGIYLDNRTIWNMDYEMTKFAQNFKALKIFRSHWWSKYGEPEPKNSEKNYYLNQLTKLSNLTSLAMEAYDDRIEKVEVAASLTQLTALSLGYTDTTEEILVHLTSLKSLQSLEFRKYNTSPMTPLVGLDSFAAQIKRLTITYGCVNLRIFTNLETLELPLTEKQVVPGLQEMLESLPKLTSLLTRAFAGDMSKLTALKNLSLQSETKEERNIDITNFPPNLEHFSCISEMIKCDFPTSIKSVYIGRIVPKFQSNIIEINKKQFASMTAAVGKLRCPVTLYFMDFDLIHKKPFAVAATNPNLTIIVKEDRYSEQILAKFVKFSEGPLPAIVFISFCGWKRAVRKKKFGKVLEEMSQKIQVFAEYPDNEKIIRPNVYNYDPYGF
jgi:hypothetical protein